MELFYRSYGDKKNPPMVILHGLFGMSDNWGSIAKQLAADGFYVLLPDQRNHGRSGHSGVFNYMAMVDDLLAFFDAQELGEAVLVGHSMGGKTAMQFALDYPERVRSLIVADISPAASDNGEVHKGIIDKLLAIDLSGYNSRHEVTEALREAIPNARLRQFLKKNLYWKDRSTLGWRINLEVVRDNLEEVFRSIDSAQTFDKPVLFIRGANSDYVIDEDIPLIYQLFPKAEITTIEDASHWLHAEQPEAFVEAVRHHSTKPSP
ncbi:MAG: alpha/beta fold hydrolase [Bacteroidales bacterium]